MEHLKEVRIWTQGLPGRRARLNPCSAAYSCETPGESFDPQVLVLSSTNKGVVMRVRVWVSQGPSIGQGD